MPGAAPSNVNGQNVSSTAIKVWWDKVPIEFQHGEIISYTVVFWKRDEEENETTVCGAESREVTLRSLDKYTDYNVQVLASTIKGGGPRSRLKNVHTDQDSE